MAKVTGPLLSFDASGSVGNTATYSKWKGRNYTRLRVIPRNPQSDGQAEVRTKLGAIGKNNKQIVVGGTLQGQVLAVTPSDQSWMSYLASVMAGKNFADADRCRTDYDDAANATVKGYFDAEAPNEGLSDFELPYGSIGVAEAGFQMWVCADAAFRLGLAIAPVAPADMDETQVQAFGAAYTS